MKWDTFAGVVALMLLVIVAIVLLLIKGNSGDSNQEDNPQATYSFDLSGNLVPDKNGVIDAAFARFLKNPKFDPNAPVIIDQFYAVGLQHNYTDGYYSRSNSTVVVRRGFPFVLMRDPNDKVKFNLDEFKLYFYRRRNVNNAKFDRVDHEKDKLLAETQPKLYFNKYYGTGPILRDNTIQVIKRTADYIIFNTPVTAVVDQYQISGFPTDKNVDWDIDPNSSTTIMVNVIFNPYHPGDIVYNPDKALLNEYIHNEYGCNLQGDSSNKGLFFWNYEQFDSDCLDASYKLLQFLSNFKDFDRSDPVSVIRGITFATNSEILNGLWLGVNKPQEITVKNDASDLDQRNLPDNFNRPFTVCNSISDCKDVFTNYRINDKPVTDVLCTPSYNEPASIKNDIDRICSLNTFPCRRTRGTSSPARKTVSAPTWPRGTERTMPRISDPLPTKTATIRSAKPRIFVQSRPGTAAFPRAGSRPAPRQYCNRTSMETPLLAGPSAGSTPRCSLQSVVRSACRVAKFRPMRLRASTAPN